MSKGIIDEWADEMFWADKYGNSLRSDNLKDLKDRIRKAIDNLYKGTQNYKVTIFREFRDDMKEVLLGDEEDKEHE